MAKRMQIFGLNILELLLNWTFIVNIVSGHQNYMGVVSKLLIASPGHRPMETHYVH